MDCGEEVPHPSPLHMDLSDWIYNSRASQEPDWGKGHDKATGQRIRTAEADRGSRTQG